MSGFSFDQPPSPGTNRAAPPSDCENCGGLKLIDISGYEEDGREVYARCPVCNPGPTARAPVQGARWQDYDR